MPVYHQLTATTPDDPNYEIRPSAWNSAHAVSITHASEISQAFSNDPGYNVSFTTIAGNKIVASANVTAAPSPVNVTGANGSSVNAQTIAFSNLNGVSLGVSTAANGATVTGSITIGRVAVINGSSGSISFDGNAGANGNITWTNDGNTIGANAPSVTFTASNTSYSGYGIVFSNSNNVSFGLGGVGNSRLTASVSQSVQPVAASAANGSVAFSTLNFSNANGISFGTSAGTAITASHNAITTARASNDAVGLNSAVSNVTATINSSGLSLDARGYAGTATAITGNASITLNSGGLSFNGSNLAGVGTTFNGTNASASMTLNSAGLRLDLSAAAGAGGGFTGGVSTGGNTSGNTGTQTGQLILVGGNNITLSVATAAGGNQSITISGANAGGAQTGISGIVVSNTTYTSGTVSFSNANGISFGSSAGQAITASYTVPSTAGLISAINVSAGTTSNNLSAVTFSNSNGISFGLNGSVVTGSHNALTTARASNDAIGLNTAQTNVTWTVNSSGLSLNAAGYAGTGTSVSGGAALTLNSNGLAFNGNSLAGTSSGFTGANISATITHNTAGLALSMSVAAPGGAASATAYALSNTTQSTTGTMPLSSLQFAGAGLVSVGISNGSVVISGPNTTTFAPYSVGFSTLGNTAGNTGFGTDQVVLVGGANITLSGSTNAGSQTISIVGGAGGGVTPVASASNGSFSFTTLAFSNANNVTFGTSAGSIITASVAAPGAAAENNNINLLGANTAGNTTASGSTIGWSGLNVTLSGTNASQVVISAPATSSLVGAGGLTVSTNGSTISVSNAAVLNNFRAFEKGNNTTFSSFGQNTVHFQHFIPEDRIVFSNVEMWARGSFVSSTNSQVYAQTILYGVYSQRTGANSSQMSLAGSSSNVIQVSYNSNTAAGFTVQDGATSFTTTSGGTAVLANISGPFVHYMPFSSTLEPNVKHALAIAISSATTVGTSPFRYAPFVQTVQNSLSFGRIFNTGTQATATTVIGDREMGVYSVTSGALPSSYATSQISIAVSRQQLPFVLEV